ncbi:MAG: 6-phosphogluconolactonase [Candidatus Dormibacteria bacterium]
MAPTLSGIAQLPGDVTVDAGSSGVAAAAAEWIVEIGRTATTAGGRFRIALAGGGTPQTLYRLLAATPHRRRVDWERWEVYFGDERACPPDDPASNYGMARRALLDLVPVLPERIHRMAAERSDLDAAASEYSSILASTCPPAAPGSAPRLDCILLGLGENGHTASLFPGDPALEVSDRWAVRSRADYAPFDRITVTYPVLNAAAHVAFLVTGAAKGEALRGVVGGRVPAAGVRPREGELRWFLDTAAADSL